MITPRISELIEKIDILNVTAPYDTNWGGTIVSTFARNVWAKIEPLGGGLIAEDQQQQVANQPYNIWIRDREGVTAFQQLDWEGTRLVMTGPPEEIGTYLLIHAEARTSRGL